MAMQRQFLALIGQPPGEQGRASKYSPEHCHEIRLLAQQGRFAESWCVALGVTPYTMREWARQYPEFRDAVAQARLLLVDYWTTQLADNLNNPNAKPGLYTLMTRRLSAVFGENAKDLAAVILDEEPITPVVAKAREPGSADTPQTARTMATADLEQQLAALRARRAAEEGK